MHQQYYLLDLGTVIPFRIRGCQGHQVFLISWRSAVPETGHLTWTTTLKWDRLKRWMLFSTSQGLNDPCARILRGRYDPELCRRGPGCETTGQARDAHATDHHAGFSDTGEIGLLIDHGSVALREAAIGKGGILPGKELAFTFGTLRANDLIWRYVSTATSRRNAGRV